MSHETPVRIHERLPKQWEVTADQDVHLSVQTFCEQTTEIEKVYGPLIFATIRVTPSFQTCEWIIERQRIDSNEWLEVARIPGQLDCEYDESHPDHREIPNIGAQERHPNGLL